MRKSHFRNTRQLFHVGTEGDAGPVSRTVNISIMESFVTSRNRICLSLDCLEYMELTAGWLTLVFE